MELLDLSQISARLKSQCNLLRTIGEAADFAAITDEAKNPPAAYVLPLRDEGFDESTQAHAGAMVSVHFGICMAVKNLRDVRGAAGQGNLRAVRLQVLHALFGWTPPTPEGCTRILWSGGRLLSLKGSTLWWQDDFITRFYMEA